MKRNEFYVCWTMDCESILPPVSDPELGTNALSGYAQILEEQGWHGTLFVVPEEVAALPDLLGLLAARGEMVILTGC